MAEKEADKRLVEVMRPAPKSSAEGRPTENIREGDNSAHIKVIGKLKGTDKKTS